MSSRSERRNKIGEDLLIQPGELQIVEEEDSLDWKSPFALLSPKPDDSESEERKSFRAEKGNRDIEISFVGESPSRRDSAPNIDSHKEQLMVSKSKKNNPDYGAGVD